jgi:hypothetical protein
MNKWLVLTVLFLLGYSCKSSKETTTVALQKMTKEERLSSILQSEISYNTLSSNLRFTLKPGKQKKEVTVDAQLRIIRNEAIQFSLRIPILGSEAFKILITPENVLIVDRLNKQYLLESMENIKAQAPFDFDYYSFEAVLTDRLFIAGKKEITPADYAGFGIREDDYLVNIIYTDQQAIRYDFTGDYSNRIQLIRMDQDKWNSHLQCNYADWGLTSNKRTFPMSMNLKLDVPNDTYRMDLAFKSVEVDSDFTLDYNAPNKYRQITLQQIVQLIKNLL